MIAASFDLGEVYRQKSSKAKAGMAWHLDVPLCLSPSAFKCSTGTAQDDGASHGDADKTTF
jgi:hypothetical protein